MESFAPTVNGFQSLTDVTKFSIFDVCGDPRYAFGAIREWWELRRSPVLLQTLVEQYDYLLSHQTV